MATWCRPSARRCVPTPQCPPCPPRAPPATHSPAHPQIFLWSLRASELTGMAFIDTQLYIHQMISVKNFILAADVMKSISLLRYQEESKTLSLVSRVRRELCCATGAGGWRLAQAILMPAFPGPPVVRMPSPWKCTAWTSWWTTRSWASWVSVGAGVPEILGVHRG